MNKLEGAMKVVELRERARDSAGEDAKNRMEARRNATEQLTDAQYSLAQALEGVKDAEEGIVEAQQAVSEAMDAQREAVAGLAEARRDAARAIVDTAFEEREANLSLREAELGVLDAKERLREFMRQQRGQTGDLSEAQAQVREAEERLAIARREGNQAEISAATSQLSVARQNVGAIRDQIAEAKDEGERLRINVERSELNLDQAQERRRRARQENARRQQQGVEGSPEVDNARDRIEAANRAVESSQDAVTDAQRRYRDSLRNVESAQRNVARASRAVKEASDEESAAARNARREYNQLSEGQKQLVGSIENFQRLWRSERITSITDIIVLAIARAIRRLTTLLEDPEILDGFREIATQIGDIIDRFSRWATSDDGRENILFFLDRAAVNLPIIADGAASFGRALLNIARAASPLFTHLIELITGWGEDLEGVTSNEERMERFFATAGRHLDQWLGLAGAIGNLFLALTGTAASSGLSMVESLTAEFNEWAEWLRDNPDAVADFFGRVEDSLRRLLPLVGEFIGAMIEAFTSEEFAAFTEFVLTILLPTLLTVIRLFGTLADAVTFLIELPVVGPFFELAAKFLILQLALTRLIPLTKVLFGLFSIKRFLIIAAIVLLYENWNKVRDAMKRVWDWVDRLAKKFGPFEGVIKALAAVLAGGVGAATLAGALLLVSGRFASVLGNADKLLTKLPGFRGVLVGRGGLIGMFGRLGLAGAVALAAWELSKLLRKIPFVEDAMKGLGSAVYDTLETIGLIDDPMERYEGKRDFTPDDATRLRRAYRRMRSKGRTHEFAMDILIDSYPRLAPSDIASVVSNLRDIQYEVGGRIGADGRRDASGGQDGAAVPIMAHVGEWVLNKKQQAKAATMLGTTPQNLASVLFGGRTGTTNFFLGGLIGGSSNKRGEALKGYEDRIREVQATYRSFRRDYDHKSTMFALKAQYPSIPRDALDAMIPPSYRLRRFALGGIVRGMDALQSFDIGGIIDKAASAGAWMREQEIRFAKYMWRDPDPRKKYGGGGLKQYIMGTLRAMDPRSREGAATLLATAFGKAPGRALPHRIHDTANGLKWSGVERYNWKKPPPKRDPSYTLSEWRWIMHGGKEPAWLLKAEAAAKARLPKFQFGGIIEKLQEFMLGGPIGGGAPGAAVPVIAHVGEWILNKDQQSKLARRFGVPLNELRMWLFGTQGKRPGGKDEERPVAKGKTKPVANPYEGPNFRLHPHEDEAGVPVWFVQLANGNWGQVSGRAAKRIMETRGAWMPSYVRRANLNIRGPIRKPIMGMAGAMQSFARGGEVSYAMPGIQSFAAGGTVVRPANTTTNRTVKNIPQHFEIHTASPKIDIDYIMRVGAMHAEGSY
jgi:hypothetical protein